MPDRLSNSGSRHLPGLKCVGAAACPSTSGGKAVLGRSMTVSACLHVSGLWLVLDVARQRPGIDLLPAGSSLAFRA